MSMSDFMYIKILFDLQINWFAKFNRVTNRRDAEDAEEERRLREILLCPWSPSASSLGFGGLPSVCGSLLGAALF